MTSCPSCGKPVPDADDFCPHCGDYVRWERTGFHRVATTQVESVTSTAADEGKAAAASSSSGNGKRSSGSSAPPPTPEALAAISFRIPGVEPPIGGAPAAISVEPGRRGTVFALVRNQSSIVDNYDLTIEGLPKGWATITPSTVKLLPFGAPGAFEQEVQIELHPPRSAEAEARRHDVKVVATSRKSKGAAAAETLTLGVLPFEQVEVSVTPDRRAGRRKARFQVSVRNRANAASVVDLAARDTDGECRVRFDQTTLRVPLGETREATLTVRPPRQHWIGRPVDRRLEVLHGTGAEGKRLLELAAAQRAAEKKKLPRIKAPKVTGPSLQAGPDGVRFTAPRVDGPRAPRLNLDGKMVDFRDLVPGGAAAQQPSASAPLLPSQAVFRQRAWLPWWLAIAVPFLAALALLLFLFLPRTTEVPKVVGAPSLLVAQQKVADAGLTLNPDVQRDVLPGKKPGSVVEQVPAPGKKVEKGTAVSIHVAVGTGAAEVPTIVGQTLPEAEKTLRAANLGVGRTSVTPPNLKAKITSQIPEAGESVKVGTPVDLYYGKAKGAGDKAGAAGGGGGGGGGDIAVPEIDPPDAAGYSAKVTDAGLTPQVVQEFSTEQKGNVFATEPGVGEKLAKGDTVRVLVSSGFPQIVYDDDKNILRVDPAAGKALPALAKTGSVEKDPTWSADGTQVAYNADGRIMLVDATKPGASPTALTEQGEKYADPSLAPTTENMVLAVAKLAASGSDRDLCLAPVTDAGAKPQCFVDSAFAVADAKWAPNGKTILVPAVKKNGEFGLVKYTTKRAFSPRRSDWTGGSFVTPRDATGGTGVRDAAFSPDGKTVAVVANLDTPQFQLYVTTLDDLRLDKAKPLPVQACKVAWRPDGKELLVVQAGANCDQPTGQLLRVGLGKDAQASPVSAQGDNASYQPLQGGG